LPLRVDVAGYKERRRDALQRLALYLAEQVKSKRRPITMEPMPADERRIVHLTLTDNPDVTTQSIGEGENRKVVILLRQG
jgi:spoIIIJ-associated protein